MTMKPSPWVRISERQVPADVRWDVPAYNQGQMIEVAYADAKPHRSEADERTSAFKRVKGGAGCGFEPEFYVRRKNP
jgi:hypothetical protein